MRTGISTACFYPQPVEEILPVLAEAGVHAIEIFFNTESEFQPPFYQRLGEAAARLGLEIISIHPYTSLMEGMLLFSDYKRRTEDGMQQYERYFACAAALGAKFLTFHGERDMGPADSPERWARKCEVYHRLCALASSYQVTLAQENVAWCRSGRPDYIRALCRDVPELRYTLDIKQARRAGQDWRQFVAIEQERLVNIHINDYSGTESCLLPGQGTIDYPDFFSCIQKAHYNGHVLIEVYRTNFGDVAELARAVQVLAEFAPV